MEKSWHKILHGYQDFRKKYAEGSTSLMQELSDYGQKPEIMVVACSDSRVDPAILLQCDPGVLFTARNVANLIPPFESDGHYHGTSAALEYGICYLGVKHLIILGHSQCGGIQAKLEKEALHQDDFISHWTDIITIQDPKQGVDHCAKDSLLTSYQNCMSFPWIKERVAQQQLIVHLWFFNIRQGIIEVYDQQLKNFIELESSTS